MKILWHVTSSWLLGKTLLSSAPVETNSGKERADDNTNALPSNQDHVTELKELVTEISNNLQLNFIIV